MDLVRYTLQNYIGAIEDAITDQLPGGRHMQMDTWTLTRVRSGGAGPGVPAGDRRRRRG